MTRKMPVAERVTHDTFGAACADCLGVVVLDSPMYVKLGKVTKAVYRHMERYPPCQTGASRHE